MRVFRTRGLVWPFLFAPMLLVVWLSSSAGVVEEVSAQTLNPIVPDVPPQPSILQERQIAIANQSDDASPFYTSCSTTNDYMRAEIYIGHCGDTGNPIISGFRFETTGLNGISPEAIVDMYIQFSVERAFTSTLPSLQINADINPSSSSFATSNPDERDLTTTAVLWPMTSWGSLPLSPYAPNVWWLGMVKTQSLMPIFTELRQTHGWETGDPLTFILQPQIGITPPPPLPDNLEDYSRRITAQDHPLPAQARLVIRYNADVPVSTSYYLVLDDNVLQETACDLADTLKSQNAPTSIVALSVGKPSDDRLNPAPDMVRPTQGGKWTYNQIGDKVIKFAESYVQCAIQKGTRTRVTMAIVMQGYDSNVNYASGELWGHQMLRVRNLWRWKVISNFHYNRVDLVASGDLETTWNSGEDVNNWLQGVLNYTQPFINVASLTDTPEAPLGIPINSATELSRSFSVNGESSVLVDPIFIWTVEDVLSMTYSASPRIYSLPQVYNTYSAHARRWYYLTALFDKQKPLFEGILTQYGACQQFLHNTSEDVLFTEDDCDPSEMNTPYQAWEQLQQLKSSPPFPGGGKFTLRYMSDICWTIPPDMDTSSQYYLDKIYCGYPNINHGFTTEENQ